MLENSSITADCYWIMCSVLVLILKLSGQSQRDSSAFPQAGTRHGIPVFESNDRRDPLGGSVSIGFNQARPGAYDP